jgi:hypothetical protein
MSWRYFPIFTKQVLLAVMFIAGVPFWALAQTDSGKRDLKGTVTASSGEPLPNVKMVLTSNTEALGSAIYQAPQSPPSVISALTDSDGNFQFALPSSQCIGQSLFAIKKGFAPAQLTITDLVAWNTETKPIELTLSPGQRITGQAVGPENKPIAKVRIQAIGWFDQQTITDHNMIPKKYFLARGDMQFAGRLDVADTELSTTSDDQGEFVLDDLPANSVVMLHFDHAEFENQTIFVSTASIVDDKTVFDTVIQSGKIHQKLTPRQIPMIAILAEGKPTAVSFRRAFVAPQPYFTGYIRPPVTIRGTNIELPKLTPGRYKMFLTPSEPQGLVGLSQLFNVDSEGRIDIAAVSFNKGTIVSCDVKAMSSDTPVVGAKLAYRLDQIQNQGGLEVYVSIPPTDEQGQTKFVVPPLPATVSVTGTIPGFISLPERLEGELSAANQQRFVRRIDPVALVENPNIEFELESSPVVSIEVVNEPGTPEAGISFGVDLVFENRSEVMVGETDNRGRVELNSLFGDATYPYEQMRESVAEQIRNGRDVDPGILQAHDRLTRIVLFDEQRRLGATFVIPHPAQHVKNQFQIKLQPCAELTGMFVDANSGKPISDVEVTAMYFYGLVGRALDNVVRSNDSGQFALAIIPDRATRLRIAKPGLRFSELGDRAYLLRSSESGDLGAIQAFQFNTAIESIDIPDLQNLDLLAALDKLANANSLVQSKLPENPQTGQFNSTDALNLAKIRISEEFGRAYVGLANQYADSPNEMKILLGYLENVISPMNETNWQAYARDRICDRFLNEPEVQDQVRRAMDSYREYRLRWIHENSNDQTLRNRAAVQMATNELLNLQTMALVPWLTPDRIFAEQFAKVELLLIECDREKEIKPKTQIYSWLQGIPDSLKAANSSDSSRCDKVLELVKRYLSKHGAF